MFDLEKFKSGEYYVHLPTQELYDDVMEFLEKNKLLWLDGDVPTNDNRWFEKRKQTCIRYGKNNRKRGLVYSSLDYYKTEGYERLDINEYEKEDINMFDLEKFKTGEYYLHLPTQEIYDDVMEYLNENGFAWVNGDNQNSENRWTRYRNETCIRYGKFSILNWQGLVRGPLDYFKERGYKQLEINKYGKGDDNMNEKIKRDLIKMLFEKEFYSHEIDRLREYKGRIIFDYFHKGAKFIDFIDKLNEEYKIKGHEVTEIIIEEFELEEYKEEE